MQNQSLTSLSGFSPKLATSTGFIVLGRTCGGFKISPRDSTTDGVEPQLSNHWDSLNSNFIKKVKDGHL